MLGGGGSEFKGIVGGQDGCMMWWGCSGFESVLGRREGELGVCCVGGKVSFEDILGGHEGKW